MGTPKWLGDKINALSPEDKEALAEQLLEIPESTEEQAEFELIASFTDQAKERFRNFGKMQGLSTGYPQVDRLTLGLVEGELIVIAGETSRGKTTLALNIANNVALKRKRVLFVTLEMTPAEITSRFMAVNGGENDDYWTVAGNIIVQKSDELNWKTVDKLVENSRRDFKVDLVVIDYLQYFTREIKNQAEDLGRITKEFKKNALRHHVPIILICALNRGDRGAKLDNDRLRGSSLIGFDADIVLMVDRQPEDPEWLVMTLTKHRNRRDIYQDAVEKLYFDKVKLLEYKPFVDPFHR